MQINMNGFEIITDLEIYNFEYKYIHNDDNLDISLKIL